MRKYLAALVGLLALVSSARADDVTCARVVVYYRYGVSPTACAGRGAVLHVSESDGQLVLMGARGVTCAAEGEVIQNVGPDREVTMSLRHATRWQCER